MSATTRRALLAMAAALASCSVLPNRPYQARRVWPLVLTGLPDAGPNPHGRILLVRSLTAGPGLQTRSLQTLAADGSVSSAYYEEWAVAPADGVEEALRQSLAGSGLFAAVITPDSRLKPDLILEGELLEFAADPSHGTARATLSVIVTTPEGRRPLLQWRNTAQAPLASADPPAVVQANLAALRTLLDQLRSALSALV